MKRQFVVVLGLAILVCGGMVGCSDDSGPTDPPQEQPFDPTPPVNPQDKGDRLFGIAVSEGEEGFQAAFPLALQAGLQVVELPLTWDSIETAPGVYQDPNAWLAATSFYGVHNVQVMLSMAVINTVTSTVPDHLAAYDWDAPELILAFNNLMDWVMSALPQGVTVAGLAIGNEVNHVLTETTWDAYETFYEATGDHFRTQHPGIPVGVKCTVFGGVFGFDENRIKSLNEHSDVIMLNYYQQDSAFVVFAPSQVHNHFTRMTQDFQGRTIWLTEVGYQSGSEHCGSSEAMQAIFFHELFTAWDQRRFQITYLMINWLHDQSPAIIAQWEDYYGSSDPGFVEYLSTLGLRTHEGQDKDAWLQLLAETGARGWAAD